MRYYNDIYAQNKEKYTTKVWLDAASIILESINKRFTHWILDIIKELIELGKIFGKPFMNQHDQSLRVKLVISSIFPGYAFPEH